MATILEAQENLVGTFYGGWARNRGNYIWTKDHGQGAQLIATADVNSDGYDDAVAAKGGVWTVAMNISYKDQADKSRRKFDDKLEWLSGFGNGYDDFFVGDLDADGKSDIAVFKASTGTWEFALSDGSKFVKSALEISGFGQSSTHRFLADVNADGKSDAIAFQDGTWSVCINNGVSFAAPATFISGFGDATAEPFVADVNRDAKADAIYVKGGSVFVSLSASDSFVKNTTAWRTGLNYTEIMMADATGDSKADVITFDMFGNDGKPLGEWNIYASNGTSQFGDAQFWCRNHGSDNSRNRPSKGTLHGHQFFTGYLLKNKRDSYGPSPISFNNDAGYWEVMPPLGLFPNSGTDAAAGKSPNWYCSWQYNNRAGLPRIGDKYYGFDAEQDDWALTELIRDLADAEIDYVMLDQTNPWESLLNAHRLFAKMIQNWNMNPANRKVRYTICGRAKANAGQIETSAKSTWQDFYHTYGTDNYQKLDGKPLLVCYGGLEDKPGKWAAYSGSKEYGNRFNLKWMEGDMRYANTSIDFDNIGDWYGWGLWDGSIPNEKQMVVQPGFYNGGVFFSRSEGEIEGDRYRKLCWDKVLLEAPKDVTVISFVGDMEQNDVMEMIPGEFLHGLGKTEHWSYPDMYWDMTKDFIQNFKKLKKGQIEAAAEYGNIKLSAHTMTVPFTKAFDVVPVVIASIKGNQKSTERRFQIKNITKSSFDIVSNGVNINADILNWLAAKPGNWKTTTGLKIAVGRTTLSATPQTIDFTKAFSEVPSLLSMSNSQTNASACVTAQSNVSSASFEISLKSSSPITSNETVAWVAVEQDKRSFWSGRYCAAQTLSDSSTNFTLPEYFYDDVLTITKSNTSELPLMVTQTNNLGGTVQYQSSTVPSSDEISLISFDGAGGVLYAKSGWSTVLDIARESDDTPISIYPNPVNDILYVQMDSGIEMMSVSIFNMTGVSVHSSHASNTDKAVNVSQLTPGIYILEVIKGNKKYNGKFIKL